MQGKEIKINKMLNEHRDYTGVISSLFAIVIGLLCGLVIMLISNPAQAMGGVGAILAGGFYEGAKSAGNVLYYAAPIMLTGLSVGFAFKTGLFNIGTPGQYIFGAFAAVMVGDYGTALGPFQWVVAILASFAAGGAWGLLTGFLKAYANVHEVITSIMMNYIGMYLVNMMVQSFAYDSIRNQSLPVDKTAVVPPLGLDNVFSGSSVNGGIIIAIAACVVIYFVLNKTKFGYELKAVGFNRDASKYAGINEKRTIIMSMLIAGALAGLGGGVAYLTSAGKHIEVIDVLAADGFTGITVALLGLSNPIGIIFSGIFIGYITVGGFYMQLFNFVPDIISIITAMIIYFSAFALVIQHIFNRRRSQL